MSNPRPCAECGEPDAEHYGWYQTGVERHDYRPAKRTEPLRAISKVTGRFGLVVEGDGMGREIVRLQVTQGTVARLAGKRVTLWVSPADRLL